VTRSKKMGFFKTSKTQNITDLLVRHCHMLVVEGCEVVKNISKKNSMSFPWLLMIILVTVNLLNNPYHQYI